MSKRERKLKRLNELREIASNLEDKINKQRYDNLKALNIRNLKIFGKTLNLLIPFAVTAGITIGAVAGFEGGLPFIKDDVTKYKVYSLDYQTNAYVVENFSYESKFWHDTKLDYNELIVYTPWKFIDNEYVRYKRIYDVEIIEPKEAIDAVKSNNYEYIKEKVKSYEEEKQVANNIDTVEENDYVIIASLHAFDKEDFIQYEETDIKNLIITIIELAIILVLGGVVAYCRDFDYSYEVKYINNEYKMIIKPIKKIEDELKKELKATKEKIKRLGGKYEG